MKLTFRIFTIIIFLLSVQCSFGQITGTLEIINKPFIIWEKPLSNTFTFKDYPDEIGDSHLVDPLKMDQSVKKIKLDNVNYLKFRKGKKVKSTLIGGAVGFGLGGLVGLISYTPCPSSGSFCIDLGPGANALGGGIIGLIPGLIIGRIVAQKTTTQGSRNSMQFQKQELRKNKFWD